MTNKTTTETRELIKRLLEDMCSDPYPVDNEVDQIMQLIQSEKQDLLERVEKEVIGGSDNFPDVPPKDRDTVLILLQTRDRLRAEQRKKLAELKGEKIKMIVKNKTNTIEAKIEEWMELCSDHEFDYVNDGAAFLSSALRQTREETIEEVEVELHRLGDTSKYPEWKGAAGINIGLIPKENVLRYLEKLKTTKELSGDEKLLSSEGIITHRPDKLTRVFHGDYITCEHCEEDK